MKWFETKDWPSSNYPIFIALMLLAATAATLAIGDEKRAEQLAIYAYYFLVIGVVIRFFELTLPEGTLKRLSQAKKLTSGFIEQHVSKDIQKMGALPKELYARLRRLHIVEPGENIAVISETSRNIAIFLSVFFIISLIYGSMIDWWFVRGYLSNLILIILGFLTLHIFTRVGF